jgi:predicted secreted hydrolase
MKKLFFPIALTTIIIVGITFLLLPPQKVTASGKASVEWLADVSPTKEQFKQALAPQKIVFPRDFGAHEDYQTEWWYYTGNLETESGRPFGYELTFFRRALNPQERSATTKLVSQWRSNQVYFAHFTISDIAGDRFYPSERFSRGAAKLAGAQAQPYSVWLDDWSVAEIEPGKVQLKAKTDRVALDLNLEQTLPPVLQGDKGFSRKGLEPGNASYYYSIVRQETTGKVTVGEETFDVTGLSWKDHEYSTSFLSKGDIGWDWFSLQLDNDTALMLYLLRKEDGSIESLSSGNFIAADGKVEQLSPQDWNIEVLDTWKSPKSNAQYPAKWRINIPKLALSLQGKPLMSNQELDISTVYWEGAVAFDGEMAGKEVQAKGYIELTGYANHSLSEVL